MEEDELRGQSRANWSSRCFTCMTEFETAAHFDGCPRCGDEELAYNGSYVSETE